MAISAVFTCISNISLVLCSTSSFKTFSIQYSFKFSCGRSKKQCFFGRGQRFSDFYCRFIGQKICFLTLLVTFGDFCVASWLFGYFWFCQRLKSNGPPPRSRQQSQRRSFCCTWSSHAHSHGNKLRWSLKFQLFTQNSPINTFHPK